MGNSSVLEIVKWLDAEPDQSIIKTDPKSKGRYIPIGDVKNMLDELSALTGGFWHTSDHKESVTNTTSSKGKKDIIVSASISLAVEGVSYKRVLTGAATISARAMYPNMHWSATVLSLAISNAAMNLGRRFGRYLNEDVDPPSSIETTDEDEAAAVEVLKTQIKACTTMISLESWLPEAEHYGGVVMDVWRNTELRIMLANIDDRITEVVKKNAQRIISNNEVGSYDKLLKQLISI